VACLEHANAERGRAGGDGGKTVKSASKTVVRLAIEYPSRLTEPAPRVDQKGFANNIQAPAPSLVVGGVGADSPSRPRRGSPDSLPTPQGRCLDARTYIHWLVLILRVTRDNWSEPRKCA
jgi:hypothetical protein